MPQRNPLLVFVLIASLACCLLAAGCSSSSQTQSSDENTVATTTVVTTVATKVVQTSTPTTLKIDVDSISADFISSNMLRVDFTIKNTGTSTAKNVVAGAIRVDDDQLDPLLELLESPSGVEQLLEDDVLCLDKKSIGDIPAGGYATASLSYVTDDLENCFVMKVAVADNADGVFV